MNCNTSRLIATLGLGAVLALPGTALARHGADDSAQSQAEHAGQIDGSAQSDDSHAVVGHEATDQPGAAQDQAGQSAQDPKPVRSEPYDLRGTVLSVDAGSSMLVMQIQKANRGRRGRALRGQSATIDLTGARLQVGDANGDGVRDINDVSAGDRVEARVRLPRSQPADLTQPVAAQRFKDRDARTSDDPANHS